MTYVEIEDRLFLGDVNTACSHQTHKRHNFMLVVNCTVDIPFLDPVAVPGVTYIRVPVEDNGRLDEMEKLERKLPETIAIIDQHLAQGQTVLVHCRMGRQRSAAVVAAYLMYKYNWSHDQAISYVKFKKRDAFFPEPNFYVALREYNKILDLR